MSRTARPPLALQQLVPLLMVERMEASLRFYVDGLGFVMKHEWIDEETLRWCWLEQDGVALMLQEWKDDPSHPPRPQGKVGLGVGFNFNCADALAVYRALHARGIPARRPFVGNAMWVVSLEDPDGYSLHFNSPTDAPEESEYRDEAE